MRPAKAGVVQGDEGCQGAETYGTQGQRQTVGGDGQEHVVKRQALALNHRDGRFVTCHPQRAEAEQGDGRANAPQAECRGHQHAQWGTDGNGPVGGDAVPGDHPSGILGADPADAPGDRAGADQRLGDAQGDTPGQQQPQAKLAGRLVKAGRRQGQYAAAQGARQAIHHCTLGAYAVDQHPRDRS